jgi:hypothetical protein
VKRTSRSDGQTDIGNSEIEEGFWPATGTNENVSGWAVCAGVHARPADVAVTDARHAGVPPPNAAGRSRCRSKKSVPAPAERKLRENLLAAARRREIDVVLVWRLDRWGRSLVDLVVTLKELAELGVSFVSLTEARWI